MHPIGVHLTHRKAVTSGRVFSIPPSDEDFLISSGLGTVQNKSTTLAATASPIKKPQDSLAETAVVRYRMRRALLNPR